MDAAPEGSLALEAEGIALRVSARGANPATREGRALDMLEAMAQAQNADVSARWDTGDDAFAHPTLALRVPTADVVAFMSLLSAAEHDYLITTLARGQIQTQRHFSAHRAALAALSLADHAATPEVPANIVGDCLPLGGDWVCPTDAAAWQGVSLVDLDAGAIQGNQGPFELDVAAFSLLETPEAAADPMTWLAERIAAQGRVILRRLAAGNSDFDLPSVLYQATGQATEAVGDDPEFIASIRVIEQWLYVITTRRDGTDVGASAHAAAHRAALDMLRQAP